MEFLSLSRKRSIPPRETPPAARSEEKRLFRRLPGQRTFILCSAPNLQEEFSSGEFYPITNGFTDARSIKRDHATGKVASHAGLFRGGRGRNTSSPKNACVGGYRNLDSKCFDPNWAVCATTHATGTQIVRAQMTLLDAIFCRGNKSSFRSIARYYRRKHKKSATPSSRSGKKVELDL